jgi:hypothetical protein
MRWTCACVAVLLASTTGCAGDEARPSGRGAASAGVEVSRTPTSQDRRAVAHLESYFRSTASRRTARCLALGLVREIGTRQLQLGGVLGDNVAVEEDWRLPRAEANAFADVWMACQSWRMFAAQAIEEAPTLSDPYVRRCLRDVTRADVREVLVTGASGTDDDSDPSSTGLPTLYRKFERAGCGFEGD